MRNKLYLLTILLIIAMLAAACGGATPEPAAPAAAPATEEPAAAEAPATEEAMAEAPATEEAMAAEPAAPAEEDPLGTVVIPAGDPIRLASALVIAGPNETLGTDSQTGIEVAIKERGDVAGHPVELVPEDDGCSAEGGQTAATKIASDDSIVAVVGHSCSSSCTPAAPIYNDAGLTMISPSCTAPALTGDGHVPSFLRTAHNDNVQGRVMAEFVFNELGLTTAATIHDGSPYAEQLQQVFADTFTQLGGTITAQEAVNVGDTDMRPVLTSIATASPEFLYYPVFIAEGGFITSQAKEVAGPEATVLAGADGMISPDFVAAAGEASEGMYVSGPNLTFSGATYDQFLADYVDILGQEPVSAFHAHAFDATNMIFDAIEKVATTDADGNTVIGKQALRDALYATSGLEGITGTITCHENGDCADPEIVVSQIQGGEYVPVFGGAMAPEAEATEEAMPAEATEEAMAAEATEEAMAGGDAMSLDIEPVRIAVVMPSTTTDLAWSQALYDALLEIQAAAGGEGVVEIAVTENMFNVTDAAAALRDYADGGYDIVIAHGTQYGSSMFEIAPDFPDTTFAWGTATDTGESEGLTNVFAYEARAEQGGYVNGVLAATMSKSGVIGVVGPVEAGDAKLYIDGFKAGAEATNPDVTVNISYTGSFGDTALAAEAARTHINAGADILTGSAQQVVGAIGVAEEEGVPWMGTQSDQKPAGA
ncbi:MAG: ABC transporter substrate-binding protein [Anaerolineaceae bacterium]|nr:ABC transporter substrate-binding protein [Anaerolineaceae bacterium]